MFFKNYKNNPVKYDDIQFATAIVLDRYGEIEAAKAVLVFLKGTKLNEFRKEVNRDALAQFLEEQSVMKRQDLIAVTLDYYFENAVFQKGKTNRVIHSVVDCTLGEKLKNGTTKETLVNDISRIFAHNDATMLLYLYVSTGMFREQLLNFCKVESHRFSGRTDAASDATLEQLLAMVQEEVYKYHDYYDSGTCSPDSVLFPNREKQSGAIAFIQKKQSMQYRNLFVSVGVESHLSGTDDMTFLDTSSLSGDVLPIDIDFIDLCSKIYNASSLLFSHNDDSKPYYDIFSYHRNKVMSTKGKTFVKNNLKGCSLQFGLDRDLLCQDNPTLKEKFKCRSDLWEIFDELLDTKVTIDSLYPIYLKNIQYTEMIYRTSGGKNGKLLYSITDHNSRASGGTNGKRFFILFNGYLALKELLLFLENRDSNLGVTMYDFPVNIFRDRTLLFRVKGFEDYIKYGSEICKLCSEEESKSNHLELQVNGLRRNLDIYSELMSKNVLQGDRNVQKFMNTPIQEILNSSSKFNTKQEKIDVNYFVGYWEGSVFSKLNEIAVRVGLSNYEDLFNPESLDKLSDIRINDLVTLLNNTILGLRDMIIKKSKSMESACIKMKEDLYLWSLVIVHGFVLMISSRREGDIPVCSKDGEYLHIDSSLGEILSVSDKYPVSQEQASSIIWKEVEIIRLSIWLFWGTISRYDEFLGNIKQVRDGKGNARKGFGWKLLSKQSWHYIWAYWCVVMKLASFLKENVRIIDIFREGSEDSAFLTIASTSIMEVLDIAYPIKSVSELSVLKDIASESRCYLMWKDDNLGSYTSYQQFRNDRTKQAFNNFFKIIEKQLEVHKALMNTIDSYLGSMERHQGKEKNFAVLKEASATILSRMMIGDFNQEANQRLKASGIKCNEDGFLVNRKGELLYLQKNSRTRKYVHSGGFFAVWYPSDEYQIDCVQMDRKDVEQVIREASLQ